MRLVFDYDYMLSNLSDISEVVDDGLLSEDARNVIFKVSETDVELIGVNQLITFTRPLDKQYFTVSVEASELEDGIAYMQLKSKELISFLSSYKGLRRTEVEEVLLETMESNRVKCKVTEKDTDNGVLTSSSWVFNNIPIKPNVMSNATLPKPDVELEEIDGNTIMFYTRNMFPLLSAGTSLYSKLCFGDDYVVAFSPTHVTLMSNVLCDSLKGVVLMYRSVSFMDKVLCNADIIKVAKTQYHLYFETETTRAFIKYDNKMPAYTQYIDGFKKESAFSLDRVYLKDILKRLKLVNESVEFAIHGEDSNMSMKNSKFAQDMSLLQVKGMEGVVKFKIMPEILSKAVIGNDDEFSSVLYVYFSPQPNKSAILTFTDDSNMWFSSINVKPY